MASPESFINDMDPRLQEILAQYGEEVVFNPHEGQPQPLWQAVNECPPFKDALMRADTPEVLEQIVQSLRPQE